MKAISLTALTILACLILVLLLTSNTSLVRSISQFVAPDAASARVAPASAPATGLQETVPSSEVLVQPGDYVTAVDPATTLEENQSAANSPVVEDAAVQSTAAQSTAAQSAKLQDAEANLAAAGNNAAVDDQTASSSAAEPAAPVSDAVKAANAEPAAIDIAPTVTGLAEAPVATAEAPLEVAVAEEDSPQLEAFKERVENGQAGQVVGVFVQDTLALPVLQQPKGQANYVSTQDGIATQFSTPMSYGTIGLLAHNYLSGKQFFLLNENQEAVVVYGDGHQQAYRITNVQRYQALDPSNAYSNFIDVSDPAQKVISAGALFGRVYSQPDQLVFQTCIEANGNSSWGRLFITAEKINQ